jgi:crossover junction endodeoxyribonuclease RuvC
LPDRLTIEEVRRRFESHGFKLLDGVYKNKMTPMLCVCPCGSEVRMTLNTVMGGSLCKTCGYKRRDNGQYLFSEVSKYFKDHGCELLEQTYQNMQTPMKYRCECGNINKIRFYNFKIGQRCRKCGGRKNSGANHPAHKPTLTHEYRERHRLDKRLQTWKFEVKQRDSFTCKICGDNRGRNLVSHHLNGYDNHPPERYRLENGITLCEPCHLGFHFEYGYGGNTREQFQEFFEKKVKLLKSETIRILSFDTSLSLPGVAIIEVKRGKPSITALSHIRTDSKTQSHALRADIVESWATLFIADNIGKQGFEVIVREDFQGRSSRQNHPVFAAWSGVDRALHKFGLKFTTPAISQSAVKKSVVGSGKAEKEEQAEAVRKWTGYTGEFATHDESDAAAIGLAYLIREGLIKEAK